MKSDYVLPKGFVAAGLHCGIAKKKGKKDLALFYSIYPAAAAGMFTSNIVKAAPVLVSEKHLSNGRDFRAVVANSGCANACTGADGMKAAEGTCAEAARLAGVEPDEVLVASTGVIGQNLPLKKLRQGLAKLAPKVLKGKSDAESAVRAIMTTDLVPKTARREITIDKRKITVWGCVKGAGMIHPALKPLHATMLAFIFTDAAITPFALDKALRPACEKTFNRVTVDGDTSTNDTVLALANGAALNGKISDRDKSFRVFEEALTGVCMDLARKIAADGEGATKLVEVEVRNADTERAAIKVAETIATSPLVKTAVFGCDANWGRIIAAAGRAGVKFNPEKVDIYFGGLQVARRGGPAGFSEARALKILKQKKVKITVDLHQGRRSAAYYTCDFSYDYVRINGSYRS